MSVSKPIRLMLMAAALPLIHGAGLPVVFEPGLKSGEFIARIGTSAVTVTSTGVRFDSDVALRLRGARTVTGQPEEKLGGVSSYFNGTDPKRWRKGVPHYARLRFRGVYKDIDVVYYGADGRLEYDFVAAPHADLSHIRLSFTGASEVAQTSQGDLRVVTGRGELLHKRPRVIEGGRELVSRYRMGNDDVAIEIDGHNPANALVVDPVIESATYFGGGSYEAARAMSLDSQGNVYLAGQAPSPGVFTGPFPSASNPGQDAVLIKFAPQSNTIAYYVFLGGDQDDVAYSLAVDNNGAAYLAGSTRSVNFPVASGFQMSPGGGAFADAFVAKIAPDGRSIAYSTYLGGSGTDEAYAIAVDANGAAYVGGTTGSRNFPIQGGALQPVFGGSVLSQSATGFIAVVAPAGNKLTYATLLGGSKQEQVRALALDANGAIYVAGYTSSQDFPIRGGVQTILPGVAAGFVAKLSGDTSQLLYSTYIGGRSTTAVNALTVDAQGSAIAAGYTSSGDFPVRNAPQPSYGGGDRDGFIVRLTPQGNDYLFATYLGGSDVDTINALTLESNGLLTVAGSTGSADFPQKSGLQAFQGASPSQEAFVAKFQTASNALLFSAVIGGTGDDQAYGVQVDSSGATFVAGVTASSDFPVKSGGFQTQFGGGGGDMFLVKLSADPSLYGLAPSLNVSTQVLNFIAAMGAPAPPAAAPVNITSTLTGSAAFTVDWAGTPWLNVNMTRGQAPATMLVFVNQAGLAIGVYNAVVRVIPANGAAAVEIEVTLTVTSAAPTIQSITPSQVPAGAPDTEFTLTGTGFSAASSVQVFLYDGSFAQALAPTATTDTMLRFTIGKSMLFRDTVLQCRVKNPDSPLASNSIPVQVGDRFPTIVSITNAASGSGDAIAPGEYVAISGSTLGPALPLRVTIGDGATASSALGGVRVLFEGIAAPLLSVVDRKVVAVAPWALAGKQTAQVVVEYLGVTSNPMVVAMARAAPALFTSDGSGTGQGLIFNESGLSNAAFVPAAKGSVVSIYFTGAGVMSPAGVDGKIASAAGNGPVLQVTATIDGLPADVVSIGNAIGEVTGMVQADVRVPAGAHSGAVPIQVTVGGVASQTGVVVAVQ